MRACSRPRSKHAQLSSTGLQISSRGSVHVRPGAGPWHCASREIKRPYVGSCRTASRNLDSSRCAAGLRSNTEQMDAGIMHSWLT